ncbi:uncharacterized protein [Clytia hemisphaerica]|uniref:Uncharacterized protein n=1 Tax=Clytia hemisphaerica TaxID=252671 RepID=A0A7M6DMT8_9CNID
MLLVAAIKMADGALILTFLFTMFTIPVYCTEAEGGKAHFQVHNKMQGNMAIVATKAKAMITATADSIQMVVDPGTEKVPAEDIQAQTVRLNVADIHGVKRDKLSKPAAPIKPSIKRRNLQAKKTTHKRRTFQKYKVKRTKDITATKKSNVHEKEMRVNGQSGHLHVHTDHNITAVHSQSGKLEIYIKNPDHHTIEEEAAEHHHNKVSVEVIASEAYKKHQLPSTKLPASKMNLFHIADVTGVKKSKLIPRSKSRKMT